jgi:glycosyltransferase 2 family protein
LPLKLIDAGAIVPLTIIVTTIPIAIAGWGLRESFIVALLMTAGLGLESALLLSISFGTILLLAALPGAAIWLGSGRPAVERAGPNEE